MPSALAVDFTLWLLSFMLQAALLGMTMYGLILCSDLENDFMNPHDASARINAWVCTLTIILCIGRKWVFGPIQLLLTLYNMRAVGRNEARTDVTEIFRQLPHVKKVRLFKLFFCLLCFVYCIFRLVEASVNQMLTPETRKEAHQLFQEAAASF